MGGALETPGATSINPSLPSRKISQGAERMWKTVDKGGTLSRPPPAVIS
jgi:hypothetical protein